MADIGVITPNESMIGSISANASPPARFYERTVGSASGIRPSVDSAVDMTSPSSLTPVHRLSSPAANIMSLSSSSSPSSLVEDSVENHPVTPSVSFMEYRASSFEGEPDIPTSLRKENRDGYMEEEISTSEDYFARPEVLYGGTMKEIETMIEDYKKKIQSVVALSSASSKDDPTPSSETAKALWTEKKQDLVSKLVQLRIRQQDMKENPSLEDIDSKKILGHKFQRREPASSSLASCIDGDQGDEEAKYISKVYCEHCLGIIWRMVQAWHRCICCGYACHTPCLNYVGRTCVATRLYPPPGTSVFDQLRATVSMDICPEKGLAAQNYKCHECKASIGFGSYASEEPRLCDYSGFFYCYKCHWNDSIATPARILHNWDFETRLVSRSSRQLIKIIKDRPFIRIADINPMLFSFVSELDRIRAQREKILIMKLYLTTCKNALEEKLLLQLRHRQHFVDNSDMFSLQDLVDVYSGVLEPELQRIHDAYARHICVDCQLCGAKGFVCEQCQSEEVIFPFGDEVVVCPRCSNVFHRLCFRRCEGACRRCDLLEERRRRRSSLETHLEDA